ncbi:MAG: chromosome segregation protein SMC, partial [Betaproteobacteria bacterium]|nr:chromosome segregation protein SMC [Betaproteobacteria bacterium]
MRLTQINLAGFKSFVDPTHIPVPGQLVGIVGPNGCGKSNVIDAVRWVLGETSARHLRGETMQDVLFNGSGERKPVNRASVELIFDNSLGKAAGQWSKYGEISIKRVLERDGDSSYHINNIHVRRRDVADIFLGTGLGSRAYAIIEQGMISRVIEAKPEELRIFLEEAAGVSKYRERRRETELRLADTRSNLQRVNDILQELDKQLEHLRAQAEVARQYRDLQGALHTTQNCLWLLRKQEALAQRNRHAREVERLGLELEAGTARLRGAEKRIEELRAAHYAASDQVHAAQGTLYEANSEVARLEQQIEHVRDSRNRVTHQIAALRTRLEHGEGQLAAARAGLSEWRTEEEKAGVQTAACEARAAAERDKLPVAEEAYRATQTRRDELQRALAQAEQTVQVEQTRREHTEKLLQQLASRRERLEEERAGLAPPDAAEVDGLRAELDALEAGLAHKRDMSAHVERELPQIEQRLRERNAGLDEATQQLTGLEARRSALQQLQDRLARGEHIQGWLASRNLERAPRLWQGIAIEPGWEDALEAVLRERLNSVVLDRLERAASWFSDPPPGKITVFSPEEAASSGSAPWENLSPLQSYVTCGDSGVAAVLRDWLHGVYVVADSGTGFNLRSRLPAGGMLVTREGHLFSRHGVSFHAPDSEYHGVLSRQREIEHLGVEIGVAQQRLSVAREAVSVGEQEVERGKSELARLHAEVNELQERQHALQMQALRLTEQAQRAAERAEQIAAELEEVAAQNALETGQREAASATLDQVDIEVHQLQAQVELATDLYRRAETVLGLQRESLQQAEREHQEALFHLKTCSSKINEIENSINVFSETIGSLSRSMAELERELAGYDEAPPQEKLQQALVQRAEREQALKTARDALEEMESTLKQAEQERLACEQKLDPLRERIAELRLKEQEARLTEEQFAQQLAGADEHEIASLLEKGARPGALQAEINRLNDAITALGAVNLAALEELQNAEERRNYLDAQSRDLTEAMATLEDAIRRIDRETRERLQHTFDEVNRHFGTLFPALFGGGHARLVLTGEEILDSGVQAIAQPPGKKNTTIHLLSGGEKALTALALVFSMFQLNPAPFCLLDEVDAPLDDHNTERFCELVMKMSGHSQFLFISHNKITM